MDYQSIHLQEKFSKISEHWSPKIIAQMNDCHLKLAKVQGEFIWHDHPETDEVFLVIKTGDVVSEKTAPNDVWI